MAIEPLRQPCALDLQNQVAAGLDLAMQAARDKGTLNDSLPIELNGPTVVIDRPEPPSSFLVPESNPAPGAGGSTGKKWWNLS